MPEAPCQGGRATAWSAGVGSCRGIYGPDAETARGGGKVRETFASIPNCRKLTTGFTTSRSAYDWRSIGQLEYYKSSS